VANTHMMIYLQKRWEENRADQHTDWGGSWWSFEVDERGYVQRQIEIYDNGTSKRYSKENPNDDEGALAEKPLCLADFKDCMISKEEFDKKWNGNGDTHQTLLGIFRPNG